MYKIVVIFIFICPLFGNPVLAQNLKLQKIIEHSLPEGYQRSMLEVVDEEIVLTSPEVLSFYWGIKNEKLKEVTYRLGRGPGEIGRAPFGIAILEDRIVFADSDLQRLFMFDKKNSTFSVQPIKPEKGFSFLNSTLIDSLIFVRNRNNSSLGVLYNPYTKQFHKELKMEKKFDSIFLKDGQFEIYHDTLLFGSMYEGYVSLWSIEAGKEEKRWEIFSNKNTKERKGNMGRLSGFVAPRAENQIIGLSLKVVDEKLYFLILVNSFDGKYRNDEIYIYDTQKEKITSSLELEGSADLFDLSGDYLYVHYNEMDKLVKYKLIAN